jgi:phage-related protein
MTRSKTIIIDRRAEKEIRKFPKKVQLDVEVLVDILERYGKLEEPDGKKLNNDLYEIRIRYKGQWRIIYAYAIYNYIIILSAFHKKSQKTPVQEIMKAKKRLEEYI